MPIRVRQEAEYTPHFEIQCPRCARNCRIWTWPSGICRDRWCLVGGKLSGLPARFDCSSANADVACRRNATRRLERFRTSLCAYSALYPLANLHSRIMDSHSAQIVEQAFGHNHDLHVRILQAASVLIHSRRQAERNSPTSQGTSRTAYPNYLETYRPLSYHSEVSSMSATECPTEMATNCPKDRQSRSAN